MRLHRSQPSPNGRRGGRIHASAESMTACGCKVPGDVPSERRVPRPSTPEGYYEEYQLDENLPRRNRLINYDRMCRQDIRCNGFSSPPDSYPGTPSTSPPTRHRLVVREPRSPAPATSAGHLQSLIHASPSTRFGISGRTEKDIEFEKSANQVCTSTSFMAKIW